MCLQIYFLALARVAWVVYRGQDNYLKSETFRPAFLGCSIFRTAIGVAGHCVRQIGSRPGFLWVGDERKAYAEGRDAEADFSRGRTDRYSADGIEGVRMLRRLSAIGSTAGQIASGRRSPYSVISERDRPLDPKLASDR